MPPNDPLCLCGHLASEHDATGRCRHVDMDPAAPDWAAKTRCGCKELRRAES